MEEFLGAEDAHLGKRQCNAQRNSDLFVGQIVEILQFQCFAVILGKRCDGTLKRILQQEVFFCKRGVVIGDVGLVGEFYCLLPLADRFQTTITGDRKDPRCETSVDERRPLIVHGQRDRLEHVLRLFVTTQCPQAIGIESLVIPTEQGPVGLLIIVVSHKGEQLFVGMEGVRHGGLYACTWGRIRSPLDGYSGNLSSRTDKPASMLMTPSWWDRTMLQADVVVIGGGIIGVSTAIDIIERDPSTKVMLLERDLVPSGASSRNAGFACVGSASEIYHDVNLLGSDAALGIIEQRRSGLALLRQRLGDEGLALESCGAHEIFTEHHPALDALDQLNDLLRPLFDDTFFSRCDDRIGHFGFGTTHALIHTPFEGIINSGRMMDSLWGMAAAAGVRIRTGCAVTSIEGGRIDVRTPNGQRTVVAERIVIATNAWPIVVDGVPRDEYVPARGQILVTSPVDDLRLHGSYHMDEGYVYFRSLGGRVLLGGARNLDVIAEQTFSMVTTSTIQDRLEQLLDTVILPGLDYTIDHRWAGIMGFSHDKRPHIERYSPHVIRAFGCNGMGVAIGSTIARQAAAMVV